MYSSYKVIKAWDNLTDQAKKRRAKNLVSYLSANISYLDSQRYCRYALEAMGLDVNSDEYKCR